MDFCVLFSLDFFFRGETTFATFGAGDFFSTPMAPWLASHQAAWWPSWVLNWVSQRLSPAPLSRIEAREVLIWNDSCGTPSDYSRDFVPNQVTTWHFWPTTAPELRFPPGQCGCWELFSKHCRLFGRQWGVAISSEVKANANATKCHSPFLILEFRF